MFTDEAAAAFASLMAEFRDEAGSPPALGQFLEILAVTPAQLRLRAKLTKNRRYASRPSARVADLNDAVFVEAAELLTLVAQTDEDLAAGILRILHRPGVAFADVDGSEVVSLTVIPGKRVAKAKPGDVLAIPTAGGANHRAVVILRNRFGTALGPLRGSAARQRPIYTDDYAVASGAWRIVGHDESLLALFAAEPEIYHSPALAFPGVSIGEFGSAETAAGVLREISREEAEEVGLLDGSYRQVHLSERVPGLLDE